MNLRQVSRLGQFSPIGQLFSFIFFENDKSGPKVWATFFDEKSYACINGDKNGFGYILGDFSQTHLVAQTSDFIISIVCLYTYVLHTVPYRPSVNLPTYNFFVIWKTTNSLITHMYVHTYMFVINTLVQSLVTPRHWWFMRWLINQICSAALALGVGALASFFIVLLQHEIRQFALGGSRWWRHQLSTSSYQL
jgi:hypothetical protein